MSTCQQFVAGSSLTLILLVNGCQTPPGAPGGDALPRVVCQDAPLVQMRGANSAAMEKPGETDCNSPAHWDGDTLYVFNSAGHPWRSAGPDLFRLTNDYRRCEYDNQANGGRWIEATRKARDGLLYGWYHNEPGGLCP